MDILSRILSKIIFNPSKKEEVMETKLSILFYSKTSKITKDGLVPIYLRVTIDGARFEQSTQRYIAPSKWSAHAGKAKGNTEEARAINYFLDALKQKDL